MLKFHVFVERQPRSFRGLTWRQPPRRPGAFAPLSRSGLVVKVIAFKTLMFPPVPKVPRPGHRPEKKNVHFVTVRKKMDFISNVNCFLHSAYSSLTQRCNFYKMGVSFAAFRCCRSLPLPVGEIGSFHNPRHFLSSHVSTLPRL